MTAIAPDHVETSLMERRYEEQIEPVNRLLDETRALRPETSVSYVDPMHNVEEVRIISLFSNIGVANENGLIDAGSQEAATRMLGMQWQLGLRPEFLLPWNVHPWHTPGEANGKFTPPQITSGLKPLLRMLKVVPRASVLIAHGTEAHRLSEQLVKTQNPLLWRRGFKTYKVKSLDGRAFAGSPERQQNHLEEIYAAYSDAMARTGLALVK
ncbi:uracil-DNA glycosylase [Paeniglutamicibacter gangotriensis]|uniref:Uracil-DNA glycosylase n=1 Tax=Paeniglutamicibacter gangotriensis TaxID=254787 RepID=A0A5B0ECT9_9MICC|nr:uracil-DNA glycosylase [Paeniglutamicibacter gangotriensis]KAA0976496.1 uracil-DNA glycosylase [Paeniglutamicibacter gangotriensis]